MNRKNECMCSRQLEGINIIEIRSHVVSDSKPFNFDPNSASPNSIELERAEIEKQLKAGII